MYVPTAFREDCVAVLQDAIRQIGFGTLVTAGAEPEASHIPMVLDPEPAPYGALFGHLARANSQWQGMKPGAGALSIFLGPNAYVSPSWYETKRLTGEVVPTWNYLAVHAYGDITFTEDPSALRAHVGTLTNMHEESRAKPWVVGDAPTAYIDKMLRGIVGFRLVITKLEGKWKMSQNRSAADAAGVRDGLGEGTEAQRAVAAIMTGRPAKK